MPVSGSRLPISAIVGKDSRAAPASHPLLVETQGRSRLLHPEQAVRPAPSGPKTRLFERQEPTAAGGPRKGRSHQDPQSGDDAPQAAKTGMQEKERAWEQVRKALAKNREPEVIEGLGVRCCAILLNAQQGQLFHSTLSRWTLGPALVVNWQQSELPAAPKATFPTIALIGSLEPDTGMNGSCQFFLRGMK